MNEKDALIYIVVGVVIAVIAHYIIEEMKEKNGGS